MLEREMVYERDNLRREELNHERTLSRNPAGGA
jgi:hypothetical protein